MRVVLVPGVLALLPEYAGLVDPVAELRVACLEAVAWLGEECGFGVHGSSQGLRLARHLAASADVEVDLHPERPDAMLVVANGSAKRTEKAPGHFDQRAAAFDDRVRTALMSDPTGLTALDLDLAAELWADVESLVWLSEEVWLDPATVRIDYDHDPLGVQLWVMRWEGSWR